MCVAVHGVDPNWHNPSCHNRTPVHAAAEGGHSTVLLALQKVGEDAVFPISAEYSVLTCTASCFCILTSAGASLESLENTALLSGMNTCPSMVPRAVFISDCVCVLYVAPCSISVTSVLEMTRDAHLW